MPTILHSFWGGVSSAPAESDKISVSERLVKKKFIEESSKNRENHGKYLVNYIKWNNI